MDSASFHGIDPTAEAARILRDDPPELLLLSRRNVEHPGQVRALIDGLRDATGLRLRFGVRHWGGDLTPFVRGVTFFPGPDALARTGQPALIREAGRVMGSELRAMGVEVNLPPPGVPGELLEGMRDGGVALSAREAPPPRGGDIEGDPEDVALAAASAALSVERDPRGVLPIPSGTRVGLLVPRLGDAAHRWPIEDGLRSTATYLRPRVPAAAGVMEVGLHADEAALRATASWAAAQEAVVAVVFHGSAYPSQRRLLEQLDASAIVPAGDPGDAAFANAGAAIVQTYGARGCQLRAALTAIFSLPATGAKRK